MTFTHFSIVLKYSTTYILTKRDYLRFVSGIAQETKNAIVKLFFFFFYLPMARCFKLKYLCKMTMISFENCPLVQFHFNSGKGIVMVHTLPYQYFFLIGQMKIQITYTNAIGNCRHLTLLLLSL